LRALIITVAGLSSRFGKSIQKDVLKCIYTENGNDSILDKLIIYGQNTKFDKIIIVGGYKFEELAINIKKYNSEKIKLINNLKYDYYGSNYSLYLGLLEAKDYNEVVFFEGDLIVDEQSFEKIAYSPKDVITTSNETIFAKKSVVCYLDIYEKLKYLYDVSHKFLHIQEPFLAIFNSGQAWKFINNNKLAQIISAQNETDYFDTNLNIIGKYFNDFAFSDIEIVKFNFWYNCNTVEDYRLALKILK